MLSDNEDAATSGELPAAPRLSPTPLAAGAGSSPHINERDADETWPDDLLRRSYEESSPAMRATLDLMANEPERRSTTGSSPPRPASRANEAVVAFRACWAPIRGGPRAAAARTGGGRHA